MALDFLRRDYPVSVDAVLEASSSGASYELAGCGSCGLIYQVWIPDDRFAARIYGEWDYDGESLASAERRLGFNNYAAYARQIMTMTALLEKEPWEIRALDYGMGWGFWARMARSFGVNVFGIELSAKKSAESEKWGVHAPAEADLKLGFDFINADQVLEHALEPLSIVKKFSEWLKPGGILRVAVPSGEGLDKMFADGKTSEGMSLAFPLLHLNMFGGRALSRLGALAGLRCYNPPRRKIFVTTNWASLKRPLLSVSRPLWKKDYWGQGVVFFRREQ